MRPARELPNFSQQDVVGSRRAQHVKAGDRDARLDVPAIIRKHFGGPDRHGSSLPSTPDRLAFLVLSGSNFQVVEKAACHRLHITRAPQ